MNTSQVNLQEIQTTDPEIYSLIQKEERRQFNKIRLVASENYASKAVMNACGSIFSNKYSEGYPYKRYYEGQENIDPMEVLAIERAKNIFNMEHANVQPLSGSPANFGVYSAFLEPHDPIMGLSLPHGGHLTHGWNASVTGKYFNAKMYHVNKTTHLIDYDEVRTIAKQHKPKILVAGISAYPRKLNFKLFKEIADEVGAMLLCDIAHISGLVATGYHESPSPYADFVTTTTHKTLRGPRGALIMCKKQYADKIDKAIFPGMQGGPHNSTIAAVAVALKEAQDPSFKEYVGQVIKNAQAMVKQFKIKDFQLITGGTDNHMLIVDLTNKKINGRNAARALNKAGIVCNANTIPYDPNPPFNPSGIRIGTPAITSRGMKEEAMIQIVNWISDVVDNHNNEELLDKIAMEVQQLCKQHIPLGLEHMA